MKSPALSEIRSTIRALDPDEVAELVLRLARFKKENKELISYLLYSAHNEHVFVEEVKAELDTEFKAVNKTNLYQAKKTIRKILRLINKFCRYSQSKQTEAELRIYFCKTLNGLGIGFRKSQVLLNLYNNQVKKIHSVVDSLHEDLRFDFAMELENL